MDLEEFDLNLLIMLDALLEERHVTRAARRLGVSQPAMSNALAKLRRHFGDSLLIRTAQGMEPTQRAIRLAHPIRLMLVQLRAALHATDSFEPEKVKRRFAIRMTDYASFVLLPQLLELLQREAPGLAIEVRQISTAQAAAALESGDIDLAVSSTLDRHLGVKMQELFRDRLVCVMARTNRAADAPFTLETFLGAGHLRIAYSTFEHRSVDQFLAERGLERSVVLTLASWLSAIDVIARSNLVAVVPERLARERAPQSDLVVRPLPTSPTTIVLSQYWHERHDADPTHKWLRAAMAEIGRSMRLQPDPYREAAGIVPPHEAAPPDPAA